MRKKIINRMIIMRELETAKWVYITNKKVRNKRMTARRCRWLKERKKRASHLLHPTSR